MKELDIPKPEYNLGIRDVAFGKRLGKVIDGIMGIIGKEAPDYVVVYGDCDSTLAGVLAAKRCKVKVAHIEAGFRSNDWGMPEEVNRIVVDELSDLCFCATNKAAENLVIEGIRGIAVQTGDIMKDLMMIFKERADKSDILEKLELDPKNYYFATLHRAENTSNKANLKAIFTALKGLPFITVFALHPRTKKKLQEWGIYEYAGLCVRFIDPVGYLDSIKLQSNAKKVITDSGSIQKEAYILKTQCVTLRNTTEYTETLYGNWNILCPNMNELCTAVNLPPSKSHYEGMFGDGASVLKMLAELGA